MNKRFTTLCSIPLLLGLSSTADAQTTAGVQGFENQSVIVSGGPGTGPVPTPVTPSLAVTNAGGIAPSLSLTNTNRIGGLGTRATPGLGARGAVVGGAVVGPPAGTTTPVTPSTITGTGVGPDTTLGGGAGVNRSGVGVGGVVPAPNVNVNPGVTVPGTGGRRAVGGLGTGSSGTGTGASGVGGLGTGSSGLGTGAAGVGGLGTGSAGTGTGTGTAPAPAAGGTGTTGGTR